MVVSPRTQPRALLSWAGIPAGSLPADVAWGAVEVRGTGGTSLGSGLH